MKEIKVLGTGCANCKSTIALIDQVAKAKGVEVNLQKVEELRDIMGYGVMSTPGVVIDGKVFKDTKKLEGLDPGRIENISVLKDASAVEKYGRKARNGVIEITTRKK